MTRLDIVKTWNNLILKLLLLLLLYIQVNRYGGHAI